ncbi:helix-turn-helix domain-containing protein [Nocardia cyriacigeorgica]|uniref:helix-turn-helix domain-containing protein n=1 Tax=Nocardia cyriacigeorgica TaxID=135487 RepID=UPI0024562955|nr:helix-turn-helix transcriptional regulator [Nocardia cyriacigeorgica]
MHGGSWGDSRSGRETSTSSVALAHNEVQESPGESDIAPDTSSPGVFHHSQRRAEAFILGDSPSEAGSTLTRRQLGRHLREARQQNNLTIAQAAALMQWSESTLQRLETGNSERIRWRDIRELCELYNLDEKMTDALVGLAQQAHEKSWWHEYGDLIPPTFDIYVGLEASARVMTSYQPYLVPGLLQTAEYARALTCEALPSDTPPAEVASRVQLKLQRQSVVTRSRSPATLNVAIHEAALLRIVGGRHVMATQLRHLADLSTAPNISIRLLPFSAGVPMGDQIGPFVILEFGPAAKGRLPEPPVVYVESFVGDLYLEKPVVVEKYHRAYEALIDRALNEVESRDWFRRKAREYGA